MGELTPLPCAVKINIKNMSASLTPLSCGYTANVAKNWNLTLNILTLNIP